jgi:trans-aconitate methyltransferase
MIAQNISTRPSIIEFGCSGGNNLKLLREMLPDPFEYCGLDISPSAIEFARPHFPDATFFCCAHTDLLVLEGKLSHSNIFLASGVLCCLPQKEVEAVLEFAARIADYIVICEEMGQFYETTGKNAGVFIHPYGLICHQLGLDIVLPPRQLGDGGGYGLFIARSPKGVR